MQCDNVAISPLAFTYIWKVSSLSVAEQVYLGFEIGIHSQRHDLYFVVY